MNTALLVALSLTAAPSQTQQVLARFRLAHASTMERQLPPGATASAASRPYLLARGEALTRLLDAKQAAEDAVEAERDGQPPSRVAAHLAMAEQQLRGVERANLASNAVLAAFHPAEAAQLRTILDRKAVALLTVAAAGLRAGATVSRQADAMVDETLRRAAGPETGKLHGLMESAGQAVELDRIAARARRAAGTLVPPADLHEPRLAGYLEIARGQIDEAQDLERTPGPRTASEEMWTRAEATVGAALAHLEGRPAATPAMAPFDQAQAGFASARHTVARAFAAHRMALRAPLGARPDPFRIR